MRERSRESRELSNTSSALHLYIFGITMRAVEFRLLRYFVAVADRLSFTAAAAQLHIAQPALSRQIRQLEEELGVQLFSRNRRTVRLTDAGRVLVEEARCLAFQHARFLECACRAKKGAIGLVRVGVGFGLKGRFDPAVIEHSKEFPGVQIASEYIPCDHQNEALKQGSIDVGVVRGPIDLMRLVAEPIFEEKFVVIFPRAHVLAKRPRIKLRQLRREPLLLPERNPVSALHDKTLELYRKAGVEPKVIYTALWPHAEAAWLLVESGKGIGLGVIASCTRTFADGKLAFVPLDEPDARIDVQVAWRKGEASPAVLAFLSTVRRVFKPGSPAADPSWEEVQQMIRSGAPQFKRAG
jgi:DNA-binding transcriptional LysR family regulator